MRRILPSLLPALLAVALTACNSSNESDGGASAGNTNGASTTGGVLAPIGTLWVGGAGSVSSASLAKSGTLGALDLTCNPPGSQAAVDGASALDSHGNLWAIFPSGPAQNQLIEWKASDLASCGTAKPALQAPIDFPLAAIAFDSSGNLWGTFLYSPSIDSQVAGLAVFSAAALATGGTPTGQLVAECAGLDQLCQPTGLAFDGQGNLWVGSLYSVLVYAPTSLAGLLSGGTMSADHLLTSPKAKTFDGGGRNPFYAHYVFLNPAFDVAGNLWIGVDDTEGNPIDHQIVEYGKAQLDGIDSEEAPTPIEVLHESTEQRASLLISWGALAFDAQGNLWAGASQTSPNLWRYPAASLTSKSPASDISLTLPGDPSISLAFDPTPAGLPLH